LPVHIFGNPVDFSRLVAICRERNIKIIEDATESLGANYKSGSFKGVFTGTIGDFGCFSFNGNKLITTGGGGMIVTNNSALAEHARYLTTQAKNDVVRYIHDEVGYNYRLTNIQAAIGVAQLELLSEYIQIKKTNFELYKKHIDLIDGLYIANTPDYANSNYWFYCLRIDRDIYGMDREELMNRLSSKKIQTRPVWYLNHIQKPYKECGSYNIQKAFELVENTLNIPCSVGLSQNEIFRVIESLKNG
jgi:dTDP-4-amino-4,6-dideoxygalactose transaminase